MASYRRETTPVKYFLKELAIIFLSVQFVPFTFIIGADAVLQSPGRIFFSGFQKVLGSPLFSSISFQLYKLLADHILLVTLFLVRR